MNRGKSDKQEAMETPFGPAFPIQGNLKRSQEGGRQPSGSFKLFIANTSSISVIGLTLLTFLGLVIGVKSTGDPPLYCLEIDRSVKMKRIKSGFSFRFKVFLTSKGITFGRKSTLDIGVPTYPFIGLPDNHLVNDNLADFISFAANIGPLCFSRFSSLVKIEDSTFRYRISHSEEGK